VTYALEAVGALIALAVIIGDLRRPYRALDPVDEAIRLRYRAGVSK
jgi:hypothetical protein